eukprot:TRINITY_DN23425_c0_g1_i1.p1 TRINITY_DN23425_c0_g1~~TRINITY_DN23425_c0_g1_i1.p1  ORF type:complete len:110 (+),score=30.06 TRINITY_DN23425_c0_g1_i1:139-468(+)
MLLWKDVTSWNDERVLGLFRADAKISGCDGKEAATTRGLEPCSKPAEWSFVPITDLFLAVGEGLVGITTEGIFADKSKGSKRKSLKECYKKEPKAKGGKAPKPTSKWDT